MTAFRLEDRVALITGGSRGIGRAGALGLARAGARVAIAARKPEGLEDAKRAFEAEGLGVETFVAHVGKPAQIAELIKGVEERLGPIDILVNNAATNPHFGPLMTADEAVFMKTMETNAQGYFLMTKAVAASLLARNKPGSIINVASYLGMYGSPLMGVYGASKAAVISLTKTFAIELGPSKIRVNAIAPGVVETKFAEALTGNADIMTRVLDRTPLGHVAQPEDIAGTIVFLASDASSYMTGQTLLVDGGHSAG